MTTIRLRVGAGTLPAVLLFAFASPSPAQTMPPPAAQQAEAVPTSDAVITAVRKADRELRAYRTKEARAALEQVAATAAGNASYALALGRVLDQEKKYGEAVTEISKAAQAAPADPAPQFYLGEVLQRMRRTGEASAAFSKAARLARTELGSGGDNAAALYYLGASQRWLKQYDDAAANLVKAHEANPSDPQPLFELGLTRALQQRWADAVAQLTSAVKLDSGLAYAYYYRALAQDKLGHKDQLVLDMERFLKLAPQAPEAQTAAAIVRAARR
jgi:tetratricopeptide (TPR) repeat protein